MGHNKKNTEKSGLEKVDDYKNRRKRFFSRKKSMFIKAHELQTLTDCEIVVIVANREEGQIFQYTSENLRKKVNDLGPTITRMASEACGAYYNDVGNDLSQNKVIEEKDTKECGPQNDISQNFQNLFLSGNRKVLKDRKPNFGNLEMTPSKYGKKTKMPYERKKTFNDANQPSVVTPSDINQELQNSRGDQNQGIHNSIKECKSVNGIMNHQNNESRNEETTRAIGKPFDTPNKKCRRLTIHSVDPNPLAPKNLFKDMKLDDDVKYDNTGDSFGETDISIDNNYNEFSYGNDFLLFPSFFSTDDCQNDYFVNETLDFEKDNDTFFSNENNDDTITFEPDSLISNDCFDLFETNIGDY